MTTDELVAKINTMDYPQYLREDWDAGCPCFHADLIVDGKCLHLEGKCWRVSSEPDLQDLYVWGELDDGSKKVIAKAAGDKLNEQQWYNPYQIIYRAPA